MENMDLYYTIGKNEVEALNFQTDELMIANMLNALNNPNILSMMSSKEIKEVLQVVKNHIITKSSYALHRQEEQLNLMNSLENARKFR